MSKATIEKLVKLIQESTVEPQVAQLLSLGLNLNQENCNGATPLQSAVLKGYGRVVELLLQAGADVSFPQDGFGIPLFNVSSSKIAQMLLDKGSRLDARCEIGGSTPLHAAVEFNALTVVKLFVGRGAALEARDNEGRTPLLSAAAHCFDKVVGYLLECGADPNAVRDTNSISPLFEAIASEKKSRQLKTAELLLQGGANIQHLSRDKDNVLQWIVRFDGSLELTQLILNFGGDVNYSCETDQETPLSSAVHEGRADLAELFLAAGASPDVRISNSHNDPERRGKTAREIAMSSKKAAIRKLFQ